MSMLNRKRLNIISLVLGIISILMIFVLPLFIPKELDTKIFAGIYMFVFLTFLGIANKAGELTAQEPTLDEKRDEKIDQILK